MLLAEGPVRIGHAAIDFADTPHETLFFMMTSLPADILIGLGGNTGNVETTFQKAIHLLTPFVTDIRMSHCIKTFPVYDKPNADRPDQEVPIYTNAAMRGNTFLSPHELLSKLLEIEISLDRKRPAPEYTPRPIDMDLLLYNDLIIKPEFPGDLELPHPRMHLRDFVLIPAREIASDMIHPVLNISIGEIVSLLQT